MRREEQDLPRLRLWRRWYSLVGIVALGLLFILIYGSTNEPVYHFKSVTQWLDKMAMFDELRTMDEQGRNGYRIVYPPEVVTNDPALRALLALGSKAVPTLEKTLKEQPHPPNPIQRVESWVAWKWRQWHGDTQGAPTSAPLYFGDFQQARMAAAGLAMLALGTNHHAGALRLIEIEAATRSNVYQNFGPQAFAVASAGLPERHQEIIAGIVAGLNDTNTQIQLMACSVTQFYHSNLPAWKNRLMELAQGPDADVNKRALWSLACADAKDDEVEHLCEKALQDKTKPPRLRSFAAAGLGMAEDKAALPLLRAVLTEQGISKDGVPTFSLDDINDLSGLINRLRGGSDPPSAFLWDSLSESDQSLLRSYQPAAPSSKKAEEVVVQALQKIVGGPSIYQVGRFQGVSLRPETIGLASERLTGFKLAHFNRLLLEDAYPLELARRQNDSSLQREVRQAIDSIEKSVASSDGKGDSTATGK
jgi:hypothetical protein